MPKPNKKTIEDYLAKFADDMFKGDCRFIISPYRSNEIFNTDKYDVADFQKDGYKITLILNKPKVEKVNQTE